MLRRALVFSSQNQTKMVVREKIGIRSNGWWGPATEERVEIAQIVRGPASCLQLIDPLLVLLVAGRSFSSPFLWCVQQRRRHPKVKGELSSCTEGFRISEGTAGVHIECSQSEARQSMRHVRVLSNQSPLHKLGDTQMKFTPKFRLAMTSALSSSVPSADLDQSSWETALIPGLPDDAALNCLLRLPVKAHEACRLVCRRWHHLLADKARFFMQRKLLGLRTLWLFTLAFHRCTGKIQWKVLDLNYLTWHTIPAMPCRDRACPRGFGCIAIPDDGTLLVCGGLVSDMDCPLHLVLKYDIFKNRWTVMTRMLAARSFFAGGVIDGRVYVAGGYSTDQFELNSAEVLDTDKGVWQPIANMGMNMASSDSAVINGRLYVTEGCAWPFFTSLRGQVYDPKIDRWEAMPLGMREGWTGLSVVIDEHLFVISEYERMKLNVYDPETDSWDSVHGPPMPERIMKPFSVSCLDSKIVVVGRGLHVAIGHVEKQPGSNAHTKRLRYSIQWQDVDAPKEFSDLTPSSSQILHA